jgi:hypothetical protein
MAATSDALAPGQLALTFTTGGVIRVLLHRDQLQRHRADKGQQQRDHHGKSRTTDKKVSIPSP